MDDKERAEYRRQFEELCQASGYPPGVRPGTSMMNTPFRGSAVLTLATAEDEWSEERHFAALPEDTKESL